MKLVKIISFIIFVSVIFAGALWFMNRDVSESSVLLRDLTREEYDVGLLSGMHVELRVYLANTPEKRSLGLSKVTELPDHSGMLFVFDESDIFSFWMKDMQFGLDFVWIDENFIIQDITTNVLPSTYPQTFSPKSAVKYVLEIPAQTAEKYGFTIGDKVRLEL